MANVGNVFYPTLTNVFFLIFSTFFTFLTFFFNFHLNVYYIYDCCCCEGVISDSKTPPASTSSSSSSSASVLSFVSTVWDNVRYSKSLTGVDLQFVRVRRQDDMSMDTLLEGKLHPPATPDQQFSRQF